MVNLKNRNSSLAMKSTLFASAGSLFLASMPNIQDWAKLAALLAPIVVGIIQAVRRPPRRPRRKPPLKGVQTTLLLAVALVSLTGCTATNLAEVVKASRHDTNQWSLVVETGLGNLRLKRN